MFTSAYALIHLVLFNADVINQTDVVVNVEMKQRTAATRVKRTK